MSIQTYLKTEFDKNPWTDETSHMHKLLIVSLFMIFIVAASEFLLKQPFKIFDTVRSETEYFKLVETINSDGGKITVKDGKKMAFYPCEPGTWSYSIRNVPECYTNGRFDREAFYHSARYDDLLNGLIR